MKYLVLLLLVGCSNSLFSKKQSDADFRIYMDMYLQDKVKYNLYPDFTRIIVIKFEDIEGNTKGYCKYSKIDFFMARSIRVDRTWWQNSNVCKRKLLIYHELGHCDLDLDHNDSYINIMNSKLNMNREEFCEGNEKEMIKDLFL